MAKAYGGKGADGIESRSSWRGTERILSNRRAARQSSAEAGPSSEPAASRRLRFVAEGGRSDRARGLVAAPFVVAASWSIWLASKAGSTRLVHVVERAAARMAERLASVRLDVDGLDKVDPSEQYVVVALHEGFADALALLRLPLGLRFAARDELFGWPGLGRYLRAAGHPRVDTHPTVSSVRRFYRQAESVFAADDSLVVFAQGSILGIEIAFQSGALRIAQRLGRPVLPVVLTGSHRVWEHPYGSTLRIGERVSMRVLDPVPPDRIDVGGFRRLEREMKSIALGGTVAPARRFVPERDGWWDGYRYMIDPDFADLAAKVERHRSDS